MYLTIRIVRVDCPHKTGILYIFGAIMRYDLPSTVKSFANTAQHNNIRWDDDDDAEKHETRTTTHLQR